MPPRSLVDMFEQAAARHGDAPLIDFMGRHYSYAETLDGAEPRRLRPRRARLRSGRPDRAVPAQRAALSRRLLRHPEARRDGGQLLAALHRRRARASGRRFGYAHALHAVGDRAAADRAQGARRRARSSAWSWGRSPVRCRATKSLAVPPVPPQGSRPSAPTIRASLAFSTLIANEGTLRHARRSMPANDVALIQYTGGTTGMPKGAMLTHAEPVRQRAPGAGHRPARGRRRRPHPRRAAAVPRLRQHLRAQPHRAERRRRS